MRVVAYIPDLLFGSKVSEALSAAGHQPVLVADASALARELPEAQVLVVDLTADVAERVETFQAAPRAQVRTLAFYSHVESEVRAQALAAGFDEVIPRSRMAREGVQVLERLAAG